MLSPLARVTAIRFVHVYPCAAVKVYALVIRCAIASMFVTAIKIADVNSYKEIILWR